MLAAALDRLPDPTWVVGCQAAETDRYGEGLSDPVDGAVEIAAAEVRGLAAELGIAWPAPAAAPGFPACASGNDLSMDREDETTGRRTEQGDDLLEEHSLAHQEDQPERPYTRPRQPAQDAAEQDAAERDEAERED